MVLLWMIRYYGLSIQWHMVSGRTYSQETNIKFLVAARISFPLQKY